MATTQNGIEDPTSTTAIHAVVSDEIRRTSANSIASDAIAASRLNVDRGEEITLAAVREAKEEAGLDVRLDHLVGIYSYAGRAPVIIVYAATKLSGELAVDDEGLEIREFDLDSIPWDDLAFRSTREALRAYLDKPDGL